ncbi:MAG: choice-of-anchor J domain-containing protein [Bacteroidaceae bacterium]|nr:choice-of-anchor J domain-containing protein [Bacteroidaceae bacterium]
MKIKNLLVLITLLALSACTYIPEPPYTFPGDGGFNSGDSGSNLPEEGAVYSVAQALQAYASGVKGTITVNGYIVGAMNSNNNYTPDFGTTTVASNILVADSPDEKIVDNCLIVQLVSGTDIRKALNLKDNPGNCGKEVELTGSLETYFNAAGLKSPTSYKLDGVTPEAPEAPEAPDGSYIFETFAKELGEFKSVQTVGNYPWVIDYSTAKATSYDAKSDTVNNEATSWLVSSSVNFTSETEAYVAFEYIILYAEPGKVADNHQLLISSDYNGDVASATWINLPYNAVEGKDWNTFYKAEVNVPAEFMGKSNVTFALRYIGTTVKAGTWEVKNFTVAHGAVETETTPETPETPETPVVPETPELPVVPEGENIISNGGLESWSGGKPVDWAIYSGSNAEIEQSNDAEEGTSSVVVKGANSNVRLLSKSYVLEAGTYYLIVYVKANGNEAGHCRLGYVPVVENVVSATKYKYQESPATSVTDGWYPRIFEFELDEQKEIAFVIMNHSGGGGASFLVDDVRVIKK